LKEGLTGGSDLSAGGREKRESGPAELGRGEKSGPEDRSWSGGNKKKEKGEGEEMGHRERKKGRVESLRFVFFSNPL
jgi:hypothetical protein